MKKILVLGNSERQKYIAEYLGKNFSVMHFSKTLPKDALGTADAVILPMPAADGGFISKSEIKIRDIFSEDKEKIYIGGRLGKEFEEFRKTFRITDYTQSESFAEENAVPTAEAAIMLAMQQIPFTISGSKCVISGLGRIGKALLTRLGAFGAKTFVLARSENARAAAKEGGAEAYPFEKTAEIGKTDIVFNTVPHMVLGKYELKSLSPKLVIDLASAPGGCDKAAADALGAAFISALALPGKHFPETAAKITAKTILSLLNQIRNGDIQNEHRT